MKRARILLPLIVLFAPLSVFARGEALPQDTRIQSGRLDNGVRWYYRKHNLPPGKMALMMHVRTGSLNETDEQSGLAHFMEHMVFNGTEHFEPGKLVPFFEKIGMRFGADLNAATSFDRTYYMLYLPSAEPKLVDEALMVMSDYAFRATLTEKEIDEERGVIAEEARARKSADQRIRDRLWPELYEGSRFAKRLPIGDPDVVAKAPRQRFVDYYRTWYRPENVSIILVGDSDVEPFLPAIRKWFTTPVQNLTSRPAMGAGINPFKTPRAFVLTDPEINTCRIQMLALRPGRPATVTVEQWREELVERIARAIMGRRFDDRVKKGQASYRSAGVSISDFMREAISVGGSATGEPADWKKMLEEVIVEIDRAREHGFTDRELDLIKTELLASGERAIRTEPTRDAKSILQEIFNAISEEVPVMSAEQEVALIKRLLPSITVKEVSDSFKKAFAPGPYAYVLLMPEKEADKKPTREEVLAAASAAWAREVEAEKTQEAKQDLLTKLPEPGKIVETTREEDLGITHAWLDNGARVHHRFMDYKKDSVMLSISFAGGGIEETKANLGVTSLGGLIYSSPATNRLPSSVVRDLMVGKNIRVSGGADGDDAFVVGVGGSPKDLETGLQLAYALITDGIIEPTTFKNWKTAALRQIDQSQTSVTFKLGEALSDLLSNGDPRRMPVSRESVEALTIDAAHKWLARLYKEGPIEVAVVGDASWDDVKPLIERYVGSLPKRSRDAKNLDALRTITFREGPLEKHVSVKTVTPAAVAYTGFVSCDAQDTASRRALAVASNVISSRLIKRVREELALVYSISADNSSSWIYRSAGRFSAGSKCKPENVDKVIAAIRDVLDAFAKSGPTQDELDNARKQILNRLDTGMREPSYWFGILQHLDMQGHSLEEVRDVKKFYEAMKTDDVKTAFNKFYKPQRCFSVSAAPDAATSAPAEKP